MKLISDYLRDLLEQLADVETFTADGQAAFFADRKTQNAVIRSYEVIGEIAKRLPDDLLATQPDIPWRAIKHFRDFLVHNYDRVDLAYVWAAVEQLPQLKAAAEAMLKGLDENPPGEKSGE